MEQGLYDKYTVIDNSTGLERDDTFVLCPMKDLIARECIRLYAQLTNNKVLAQDLLNWLEVYRILDEIEEEDE